jgi:hypothetical protein
MTFRVLGCAPVAKNLRSSIAMAIQRGGIQLDGGPGFNIPFMTIPDPYSHQIWSICMA